MGGRRSLPVGERRSLLVGEWSRWLCPKALISYSIEGHASEISFLVSEHLIAPRKFP